jgi:glycerate 2-kinase
MAELERRGLRHFMGTGLIRRRVGLAVIGADEFVFQQICLDFLATDVGQHVAVDFDARAEHLAAFFDHLLALRRVVDDVAVLEGQVILAHDGAHTLAPTAGRFQISYYFRFVHKKLIRHHNATGRDFGNSVFPGIKVAPAEQSPDKSAMPRRARVLIIPDKFKGTLTAHAAAAAIARGWRRARRRDVLESLPMSDGGDGFGAVMSELLGAKVKTVITVDAAHRRIRARWWLAGKTAMVESAEVIGLARHRGFHPFELDTFGLGAVLRAAAAKGATRCLVGIGGSATNDGGFGLARAMGWEFVDAGGKEITAWTKLDQLTSLRPPTRKKWFGELIVAVDVQNPLLGPHGCTRVYGPQKGLRSGDFKLAERCLKRLAKVAAAQSNRDDAARPGAGAAGGLGFGFHVFLGAELRPGFELFAHYARLGRRLRRADVVITGEGAIDQSTFMGKGVGQIARECRRLKIPCVGLAGAVKSRDTRRYFMQTGGLVDLTSPKNANRRPEWWLERLARQMAKSWPKPSQGLPLPRAAGTLRT